MIEIELYDIVLINTITYMIGIFTGFGVCIKYKHKLFRSRSQEDLSKLHNPNSLTIDQSLPHTNFGQYPPIIASAPPQSSLKEVVIRTTE